MTSVLSQPWLQPHDVDMEAARVKHEEEQWEKVVPRVLFCADATDLNAIEKMQVARVLNQSGQHSTTAVILPTHSEATTAMGLPNGVTFVAPCKNANAHDLVNLLSDKAFTIIGAQKLSVDSATEAAVFNTLKGSSKRLLNMNESVSEYAADAFKVVMKDKNSRAEVMHGEHTKSELGGYGRVSLVKIHRDNDIYADSTKQHEIWAVVYYVPDEDVRKLKQKWIVDADGKKVQTSANLMMETSDMKTLRVKARVNAMKMLHQFLERTTNVKQSEAGEGNKLFRSTNKYTEDGVDVVSDAKLAEFDGFNWIGVPEVVYDNSITSGELLANLRQADPSERANTVPRNEAYMVMHNSSVNGKESRGFVIAPVDSTVGYRFYGKKTALKDRLFSNTFLGILPVGLTKNYHIGSFINGEREASDETQRTAIVKNNYAVRSGVNGNDDARLRYRMRADAYPRTSNQELDARYANYGVSTGPNGAFSVSGGHVTVAFCASGAKADKYKISLYENTPTVQF